MYLDICPSLSAAIEINAIAAFSLNGESPTISNRFYDVRFLVFLIGGYGMLSGIF
jgi:hypothetical protein